MLQKLDRPFIKNNPSLSFIKKIYAKGKNLVKIYLYQECLMLQMWDSSVLVKKNGFFIFSKQWNSRYDFFSGFLFSWPSNSTHTHNTCVYLWTSAFSWQLRNELPLTTLVFGYIQITASLTSCVDFARALSVSIVNMLASFCKFSWYFFCL